MSSLVDLGRVIKRVVSGICVGAEFQESFDCVATSSLGGHMKRGLAFWSSRFDMCTQTYETPYRFGMIPNRGKM
ncbi:Hypothetical Protein FCC1311_074022 [Hondaea fermentalgiana]|uniref:Uncharacterized protein n=1 Tax=Hondaea fermentalgiana TaxID=2315210 RepID=A0A2R5GS55_9STRA|nr:Hypothetical Protein FCC1311_074022 [Hondaea fermentalgiana]|eukprot:GBG31181.1 Hypothetical Protein FCC1311_074022 [Hondaea fermentalgiana]